METHLLVYHTGVALYSGAVISYNNSMNFNDYQQKAISTLTHNYSYGDISPQMLGVVLGLAGESGEVLEKYKKILRDKSGVINDEDRREIIKELGDVLWYIATVAQLLGYSLEDVAITNNDKLLNRKERGVISGSGDNR